MASDGAVEFLFHEGHASLRLLVLADNAVALRMNAANGLEAAGHVALDFHPLMPHQGGCVLMEAML